MRLRQRLRTLTLMGMERIVGLRRGMAKGRGGGSCVKGKGGRDVKMG
jgi:hypothetical protein